MTHHRRQGVTLIELMTAMVIMSLMTGALGALAHAVRVSSEHTEGVANATQHARVTMQRISTALSQGYANEQFPGAAVFGDTLGDYSYPDTLLIWHPNGAPANPTGLPLFSELVMYCLNPSAPNELLEITAPTDTRTVPDLSDGASWINEIANLKSSGTSLPVLITDLVRIAQPSSGDDPRGAVRFVLNLRPTATEWANFRAGNTNFTSLHWPQSLYGSQAGLRQTWLTIELQLVPNTNLIEDSTGMVTIPYFGSATLYWNLNR